MYAETSDFQPSQPVAAHAVLAGVDSEQGDEVSRFRKGARIAKEMVCVAEWDGNS